MKKEVMGEEGVTGFVAKESASNRMVLNGGTKTNNEEKWENYEPYMKEESEKVFFKMGSGKRRCNS